ncbi:glycosyltransferase [Clostridium aestuarii]|uniref:Glycosyltransferase n=1 Tax=Clostridium aestuarii TaxID=338193 RepID=A0ABT4D5A4_9CLOT|nr:glycosyltransferase [Clostridium aestuarii]MCY6485380.1 glycosyltransferase [Clostridium aestuarii]
MRILFWEDNPMWIFGLPNGFRDLGHEVMLCSSLKEKELIQTIKTFKPQLIITMGWTTATTGRRVIWISKYAKQAKIPLVYWATEDPTHTFSFTLPLIQKMHPDFIFTICPSRFSYYEKLGVKAAHMDFGFHPNVNHYTAPEAKYSHSIAVVANGYLNNLKLYPNHYRIKSIKTLISPLLKQNIRVDFWGWGWKEMEELVGTNIPDEWIHGKLPFTETSKVYSSSKIILGLQNHLTQMTQRTYEILASKGFLLTSDTPELRRLFEPNKDLVLSSSPKETLALVEYYLKNDEERDLIRNQGEISVRIHSYSNRAKYMLKVLKIQKIL